jgi:hypothetical protein
MKRPPSPRATKAELAIIRDIEKASAFEKLDRGEAEIVQPRDYPDPLKRFRAREKAILYIKLSPRLRKKLEKLSTRQGLTPRRPGPALDRRTQQARSRLTRAMKKKVVNPLLPGRYGRMSAAELDREVEIFKSSTRSSSPISGVR